MRNLLMIIAASFLFLLLSYQGLAFLGETADEIMTPVEWAKDLAGLVLAIAVLVFLFSGRDKRAI